MRADESLAESPSDGVHSRTPLWARFLVLIYFFAGLTSIAYEVLWVRMLGLQFGASIFGVIITVAAFMAGLGAGSLLGTVIAPRLRRPLLLFAVLEAAVALFSVARPALCQARGARLTLASADSGLGAWYGIQASAYFLVLFVPAFAMGMGFPAVLRVFIATPVNLAKVYGLNTLGGAAGALLPLVLLPALGWTAALHGVVILGGGVALLALTLALTSAPTAPVVMRREAARLRPGWLTLTMYAGVGAAALILEIGWTRLYGMILLRTEYVLAVILSVFLLGIGAGSLWVHARARPAWLVGLPLAAAVLALLSLWGLPLLSAWADQPRDYGSLSAALLRQGAAVALLTMPVTLLLGAWLPVLSNHLEQGGRVSGAWLYGVNAVGAAGGALLGGFVLIPWLGTTATIVVAALLLFFCGALLAPSRALLIAAPLLAVLAYPVVSMPPVYKLLPNSQADVHDLAVYEDALSITHVVEQADGQRLLLADLRRMDASSDPTAVAVQQNQARLPLLLHPAPQRVLFLGVGPGISAAGALSLPAARLTGVEISRGAIDAARQWFAPVNGDVMNKIQVVHDDARRFLRSGTAQYDVIIGDLFHPDLVGRGNLLSVQQFQRARARLAPGGVFVQWVALNQFDVRALRSVLRSFKQAVPDSLLFMDGFRLALVGLHGRGIDAGELVARIEASSPPQQQELTGGEGIWTWLGRYWGPLPSGAGPVEDEWRPQIEFLLPRARYNGDVNLAKLLDYLLALRPDVEQAAAALRIDPARVTDFERAYVGTELVVRSWEAALHEDPQAGYQAQRLLRLAYEANRSDRWFAFAVAVRMLAALPPGPAGREALLTILTVRPDHVGALKALWRLERAAGNTAAAADYAARILKVSPLDREVPASVR